MSRNDGGFVFGDADNDNETETMSQNQQNAKTVRRILINFGRGLYAGFVEWHPIPDSETGIAKLGFVVGFLLKIAIVLAFGAEYLPV